MENADDKSVLRDFIKNRMRMPHIYQPVMKRLCWKHWGTHVTDVVYNRCDEPATGVVT